MLERLQSISMSYSNLNGNTRSKLVAQKENRRDESEFSMSSISHISENKGLRHRKHNITAETGNENKGVTPQFENPKGLFPSSRLQQCSCADAELSGVLANAINMRRFDGESSGSGNNSSVDEKRRRDHAKAKLQQNMTSVVHNVDVLIKENLKRTRERQELEQLRKFEDEERQRQAKEERNKRNQSIREMNARSRSRLGLEPSGEMEKRRTQQKRRSMSRTAKPKPQRVTEAERRANLGLNFVDLMTQTFGDPASKKRKEEKGKNGKGARPTSKEGIRVYMAQKKERIQLERKTKQRQEQEKKGKIYQNMSRLKTIVQSIFARRQKKRQDDAMDHSQKKTRHRKRRVSPKDKILSRLLPLTLSCDHDEQVLANIKENLMSELRVKSLASDGRGSMNGSDSKRKLQEKIKELAARYRDLVHLGSAKESPGEEAGIVFENEEIVRNLSAGKIQRLFRKFCQRKQKAAAEKRKETEKGGQHSAPERPPQEEPAPTNGSFELGKLLQGLESKSQNEKVVHLSRINTIEDDANKDDANAAPQPKQKEASVGIQAAEEILPPEEEKKSRQPPALKTAETQTVPEELTPSPEGKSASIRGNAGLAKNSGRHNDLEISIESESKNTQTMHKSSSLSELRLMMGSEQLLHESVGEPKEIPQQESLLLQESVFARTPFRDFTVKKFRELAGNDNVSRLISMREKLMKYKESTEKRYIHKMYKAKQFSPRTYQRKKRELEKWVTTEREEIRKSKRSVQETWQKTAQMIEDVQQNSLQLRRVLAVQALSYSSTNSVPSLILDSSQSATDKEDDRTSTKKPLKRDRSLDNLSDLVSPVFDANKKLTGLSLLEKSGSASADKEFQDLIESGDDDIVCTTGKKNRTPAEAILIQENTTPGGEEDKCPMRRPEKGISPAPVQSLTSSSGPSPCADKPGVEGIKSELHFEDLGLLPVDALPTVKQIVPAQPAECKKPVVSEEGEIMGNDRDVMWEVELLKPEGRDSEKPRPTVTVEMVHKQMDKKSDEPMPHTLAGREESAVNFVYAQVLNEVMGSLFPQRDLSAVPSEPPKISSIMEKRRPDAVVGIGSDGGQNRRLMQCLAFPSRKGIPTDVGYIGNYLDDIFVNVVKTQKETFIREVNQAIMRPALETLGKLQSSDPDSRIPSQLPHEMNPIVSLDVYLEAERNRGDKKRSKKEPGRNPMLGEFEQIHNKAVFDSVNEALNLIRPYGLNGEPMPWSRQQRILFKSITDPNIIIRNIKNMVQYRTNKK